MAACELDDRFIIELLVHYSYNRIMLLEKCSKIPLCSGFVVVFLFQCVSSTLKGSCMIVYINL